MNRVIVALFACLVITSCGPVNVRQLEKKGNVKHLTPEQILTLVDGNTLFLHNYNEDSFLFFDHSGRLFGLDTNKNKDVGRWDVSEAGEACIKLKDWWYGDLRCFQVYQDGPRYRLADNDGLLIFTAEQFAGDHKHLFYESKDNQKKSIRSIKKKAGARQAPKQTPEVQSTKQLETQLAETTENGNASNYTPREGELRSTVKWMAKDCPGCNLSHVNLKKADLIGANLAGADLSGADLEGANLRRADLQGADLENAKLSSANMPGANLKDCNLRGADLTGANLIRADLSGADLEGANLDGALLEGVQGLK